MRVPANKVPEFLSIADVGMSLFDVRWMTRAQSPIKLGEYLLCGVPIIGTEAVGNTNGAKEAGVFFADHMGAEAAAKWFVESVLADRNHYRITARAVGVADFSLSQTVKEYRRALESACSPSTSEAPAV
jgi:hypothetical protein